VFDAVEPVMRGVFEEFAGQGGDAEVSDDPVSEAMRSTAPTSRTWRKPAEDAERADAFRGSGFKIFRRHDRLRSQGRGLGRFRHRKGGNRALPLRRTKRWAQHEGQPGLGYISGARAEENGAGPLAKNIGPERTKQMPINSASASATQCSSSPQPQQVREVRRSRTHQWSARSLGHCQGPLRLLLIVDFRMYEWKRGGEEDRPLPQPVLMPNMDIDAFLSSIRRRIRTGARHQGIHYDIVCNGVELSSGAIRNHPPTYEEGLRHRRLSRGRAGGEVGGMLRALSLARRRTAALRRATTASSAALRRGESARGGAVR